jgi:hypothetical protein
MGDGVDAVFTPRSVDSQRVDFFDFLVAWAFESQNSQ